GQSPGSPLFTRTGGRQWRAPCRLNPTLAGGAHDRRPLLHAHIVVARCDVGDRARAGIPRSSGGDHHPLPPPQRDPRGPARHRPPAPPDLGPTRAARGPTRPPPPPRPPAPP